MRFRRKERRGRGGTPPRRVRVDKVTNLETNAMKLRKTRQIRVSDDVHHLLKRQALEYGTTISNLANHLISKFFGYDDPSYEIPTTSVSDSLPEIS